MSKNKNFDEIFKKAYEEYICLKCTNLKCQVCDENRLIEKSKFLEMGSGVTPIIKVKKSKKLREFFNKHKKILLIWCNRDLLKRAFYIYPALTFDLYVLRLLSNSLKKSCEMYDK